MTFPTDTELGRTLQCFVDWVRVQGWRYTCLPYQLAELHRFLEHRGTTELAAVDTALLLDFTRHLQATRSPATVIGYRSALRALWRYLLREELVPEDVTQRLPAVREDHFLPYRYEAHELARLDQAAGAAIGEARGEVARDRCRLQWTAFGLLRDAGLRVSEACHLDLEHYDRRAHTLTIERTKFFKTRVIPLPRSTCERLERYLALRPEVSGPASDPQAFFRSGTGRRIERTALEVSWKTLLTEQGRYHPRRREGRTVFGSSNLHALRHAFAVLTLERWQSAGRDVELLLPLLSAYLGHAKVSYTATYLHLSPRLRELAGRRLGDLVLPVLDHRSPRDDA
jgi:site-specific recombinase XerD